MGEDGALGIAGGATGGHDEGVSLGDVPDPTTGCIASIGAIGHQAAALPVLPDDKGRCEGGEQSAGRECGQPLIDGQRHVTGIPGGLELLDERPSGREIERDQLGHRQ